MSDDGICFQKGFPSADNNVVKLHVERKSNRMPQQFQGALSGFQSLPEKRKKCIRRKEELVTNLFFKLLLLPKHL